MTPQKKTTSSKNLLTTYEQLNSQKKKKAVNLLTSWYSKARPAQLVIDDPNYNVYLFLAGRGWGKTLTGAWDILQYCLVYDNVTCGVIAPTYSDLKRVVFSGDSGLLNILDKELLDSSGYNKSDAEIHFHNGSKILGFPSSEPDRLRGVQFHRVWCDELASWRYPETFDNMLMALRLGQDPKCIITTTPRPTKLIKDLVKRRDVKLVRGSTFENIDNLAPSAIQMLKERYEGTTIGRQELYAEIIDINENALFKANNIESNRVESAPTLSKIVVGIDPAVTSNKNSDETGIIVAGRSEDNHYYVLDDKSGIFSPDSWISRSIELYYKHQADRIVCEVNNGGDLILKLLRVQDSTVPYQSVRASRGKITRAEPVSSLYEQNKVHHVGHYRELEEQMCNYTGESTESPDRLDALVWAISALQGSGTAVFNIS